MPPTRGNVSGVLGLRDASGDSLADALHGVLGGVFDLLDQPDDGKDAAATKLQREFTTLRSALQDATSAAAVTTMAPRLLKVCAELVQRGRAHPDSAAQELAQAISLVRDTVAAIAGEEDHLKASLTASASRLQGLGELSDMGELKRRLVQEVVTLKDVATERDARWRDKVVAFERQVVSLEAQLAETQLAATHDPLTGLQNRRVVEACFRRWQNERWSFAAAVIDIDNFKAINDGHGHATGDAVLQMVAKTLQAAAGPADVAARVGGDEFIVLLRDVTLAQAEYRVRAVVRTLSEQVLTVGDATIQLTGSAGVSELSAGDTLASLLERADRGLYDAKQRGKNRVVSRSTPYVRDLRGR